MRLQDSSSTGEYAVQLRLTVEPVPKTLANKSLNKLLSWKKWEEIREREYARYNYRCGICEIASDDGRLECHEVFEYDDVACIQKLSKLIALCSRCHSVESWGWAKKRPDTVRYFTIWQDEGRLAAYREGGYKVDKEGNETRTTLLEDHFMSVNGCDLKTMREHIIVESEVWTRRSQYEDWKTDFGEFNQLLDDPRSQA